jgi:hypothetical protein
LRSIAHTPQSSLLGALHLISYWRSGIPRNRLISLSLRTFDGGFGKSTSCRLLPAIAGQWVLFGQCRPNKKMSAFVCGCLRLIKGAFCPCLPREIRRLFHRGGSAASSITWHWVTKKGAFEKAPFVKGFLICSAESRLPEEPTSPERLITEELRAFPRMSSLSLR